jgi:hypothetical protein
VLKSKKIQEREYSWHTNSTNRLNNTVSVWTSGRKSYF